MPTTFNGLSLAGYTTEVRPDEHIVSLMTSKVVGLAGVTAIADEPHGRQIRIEHKLTGFASAELLRQYIDVTLTTNVLGQTGTLVVPAYETYTDLVCTAVDPNPTNIGTLPDTSQSPTTYHRTIRFVFTQLS
ncbi:MAG: hypothetical protein ACKV2Q_24780 [Planctomycetaceae bacterium]